MYKEELINAGLKEKEALIYSILLSSEILPVNEIIKQSKLKRGIVYKTLYDLEEKGLVTEVTQKKKLHFKAEHPYKLSELVDNKLKEAQLNQTSLLSILPLLVASYKVSSSKPGVKIFEGIEGVKRVYLDTIDTRQTIYAMLNTKIITGEISKWLDKTYAPLRTNKKIWADVIINQDRSASNYVSKNEAEFRETRGVNLKDFDIGIELNIYGGKVAFIHFGEKKEDMYAILIENPVIYSTLKTLFLLAWDSALKLK